ncbi:hypothetical protein C2L64_13895 [Paraburkholderia hospita]|uniref:Uncharacterized protein n=2 Tax=Paraburkholderia hospita TaxID=169430 RepID=A0AAN1J9L7_9BURK|nr:hypothetical protein C2L64_13895 [Paraburkholderia hospita]
MAVTKHNSSARISTIGTLGILAIFAIVIWLRFRSWAPQLFYGDDLFNYMLYHGDRFQSKWADLFFSESGQKFRFVFSSLMHVEIALFGKSTTAYFIVNVAIHAASSTVLAVLMYRCCENWFVAFILGVIAATSHLGLYEVTQATGQVESLGLFFCTLTMLSVFEWNVAGKKDASSQRAYKWSALLWAFLAFNSHERYIVLLPWLGLFFVSGKQAGSRKERLIFIGICLLLVATNFLIKRLVFHSNFFQGTGGQPLGVNFGSIGALSSEAFLSVIGVNHGPQYLTGAEWSDFSMLVKIMTMLFTGTCLLLITTGMVRRRKVACSEAAPAGWSLYCAALIVLLLLPAVLTIRMEQRWELGPFFLFLTMVACGFGVLHDQGNRLLATYALSLIVAGSVVIESRISRSFDEVAYLSVDRFASEVKHTLVDQQGALRDGEIVIVADPGYCVGTLLDGGFFLVYGGNYRPVSCAKDIAQARLEACRSGARLFNWTASKTLVELRNACDANQ